MTLSKETTDAFKAAAEGWDAYLAIDKGGQVVDCDEMMARLLGVTPNTLIGLNHEVLIPRRVRNEHTGLLRGAIDDQVSFVNMSPSGRSIAAIAMNGEPVVLDAKYTTVDGYGLLLASVPASDDTIPLDTETQTNG